MKIPTIGQEALEAIERGVRMKDPISNLEQLGIGQRMINLFHSNKIYELGDLMGRKKEELMKMSNFGERQMYKLFLALSNYHLLMEE